MMYTLKKTVPLSDGWDVIVVGGGPGGSASAVAAARAGAKTLLLEGTGCAGGMATSGLVPAWCPFSDGEKIIYRGLAETVFQRSRASLPHTKSRIDWVSIDPEALKRVWDELFQQYGVTVLYHTFVSAVEMKDNGTIDAVIAGNKAGLAAYRGKVFIDGTGDGDLAAWAGAPFEFGEPETGALQYASLCFTLSNVDSYYYNFTSKLQSVHKESPIHQIVNDPEFPEISDNHICQNFTGPGTVGFNAGHLKNIDPADPACVTKAMMEGRRMADAYCRALRKYDSRAFGGAHLVCTANLLGIREGRRIKGDYVFTFNDYLERRSFEDEIGRNAYYLDIHGASPEVQKLLEAAGRYQPGESHGIPYRILLPETMENLLVCGRCISSDRLTSGSIRVMPVCLVTGEAAGTAAAVAVREKIVPRQVNTVSLRSALRENGAYFL